MVFEVKARDQLEKAKEAISEAYLAYEECQGQTDLDLDSGDLARALHTAQVAVSALNTFMKFYHKEHRSK